MVLGPGQRLQAVRKLIDRTDRTGSCWLWQGAKGKDGYGNIKIAQKTYNVHRLAFRCRYGEIPDGLFVCHACDTRNCVRPAHLWLGTPEQNNKDTAIKGRVRSGHEKLTASAVRDMRKDKRLRALISELQSKYGVSPRTILDALTGRSWKNV